MLASFIVPNESPPSPNGKRLGGKRPGAGRKREIFTPFSAWADAQGFSTKTLAARLGVSISAAKRLMTETMRPSLELAAKIAELSRSENGEVKFPPEYWLKVPKSSSS